MGIIVTATWSVCVLQGVYGNHCDCLYGLCVLQGVYGNHCDCYMVCVCYRVCMGIIVTATWSVCVTGCVWESL